MPYTKETLISLLERASAIDERLGERFVLDGVSAYETTTTTRLEAWCQLVAGGDWERFHKRLAWDGWDVQSVRKALSTVRLKESQPLPAWGELLDEVLRNPLPSSILFTLPETGCDYSATPRFLDPQKPCPFEEVFLPFITVARRRLVARTHSCYHLLTESAHVMLERNLLQILTFYCAPAIYTLFSAFRAPHQSSLDCLLNQLSGNEERQIYDAFIADLLKNGLLSLFETFPVLGRIMATISNNWVEANAEFLARLQADWADLVKLFHGENEPGPVVSVVSHLSDSHNNGRVVMALTFASGTRLIYKPKDLLPDKAYYELLTWLNEHGMPLPFKTFRLLTRSTYGWCEFVEHTCCRNEQEVQRYCLRAGMLLCLLYALLGTDAHYENIIAVGEYPVLIDLETLVHPPPLYELEQSAGSEIRPLSRTQIIGQSVLRTGMLPTWECDALGQRHDSSALRNVNGQKTAVHVPHFRFTNTDTMTLSYEPSVIEARAHLPLPAETGGMPSISAEEIIHGFCQMYRFLMEQRSWLLAVDGPLAGFSSVRMRFLHRPTRLYISWLLQLLQACVLRDGADFSIQFDVFNRELLTAEAKPSCWTLFKAEQQALLQGDIPYFTVRLDTGEIGDHLYSRVEPCFTQRGYTLLISRLRELSEADLEQQIGFIRASLCFSDTLLVPQSAARVRRGSDTASEKREVVEGTSPLMSRHAVQTAIEIACRLQERAISLPEGGITWLALEFEQSRYILQSTGYNMYDGSSGIALFLAALSNVTGRSEFHRLALAALQPLRQRIQSKEDCREMVNALGPGGTQGTGSLIYALVLCSSLLGVPVLLQDARRIAEFITPEYIAADRKYDVSAGVAGLALGLLALHRACNEATILERIAACGHHLVKHRVASQAGLRAWMTAPSIMPAGFAHGAAGIAYALLRIYQIHGEALLREVAEEAIAYEGSIYFPEVGNWLDLRYQDEVGAMTGWCHGAPGIGLARLAGMQMLTTSAIRKDIERALAATRCYGLGNIDHLCCGNSSRIELLREAARRLFRPDLLLEAEKMVASVLNRAESAGFFYLSATLPGNLFAPGLFQGLAGIGYMLLRQAHPDRLPSVLLWE